MSTQSQLEVWAERNIGPTFLGCFPADQPPTAAQLNMYDNCSWIFNYGNAHGNKIHHVTHLGLHWCGCQKRTDSNGKTVGIWGDSMGNSPDDDDEPLGIRPTHFRQFFNRHFHHTIVNDRQCQAYGSDCCGQWSLWFCKYGIPATNPEAFAWLTDSLRRNDRIITAKVKLN